MVERERIYNAVKRHLSGSMPFMLVNELIMKIKDKFEFIAKRADQINNIFTHI